MFFAVFLVFAWRRLWRWAWGYERGLTGFCGFVKIRVFVGISVFTRVLVYRTFVYFQGVFGEDFTQFLPNGQYTSVRDVSAFVDTF